MGRKREPYLLFQRGLRKSGKKSSKDLPYYVIYRNYEGEQISPVSSGEYSKTAAHAWAALNMDKFIRKSYERKGDPLKKLLTDFYSVDSSILKRRTDRGENIGVTHRKHCASYCINYFIPFFTDNGIKSVQDVTRSLLRELQDYILDKGNKAKTVNSALSALRQIFSYLEDEEEIKSNPFYGLKQLAEAGEKTERGAFPLEKVKMAFRLSWYEKRDYLLSVIGASCGLRNSEINALQRKSMISKDGFHYFNIKSAFSADKATKTQAGIRLVPIHPFLVKELDQLIDIMEYKPDDYIFWEKRKGQEELKELPYKVFGDSVVYAAKKMGLTENYLNDNNITFYGWRHFYNSLLVKSNINIYKIKVVMGHSLNAGSDMTANYYKSIDNDYSDIINAVGVLFC